MTTSAQPSPSLEPAVRQWGQKLFALLEAQPPPSLFSAKGAYGAMMDWAMKDESFKVQLFRFVDVLPTLTRSSEVARHLTEYLDNDAVALAPPLRAAIKASRFAGGLLGGGIKSQISSMARMFMLGNDEGEIAGILRGIRDAGASFTVDVLGEAVVSEAEADVYAQRYLALLEQLARDTAAWPGAAAAEATPRGPEPRLNLSVKLSAFYSQIHAADPDTAVQVLGTRLRPLFRRARDLGAFLCVDMESFALKDLTLRLFTTLLSEPEFAQGPACGIAVQAYLKSADADLRDLIAWARARRRRVTVRLVKGAYWDYETVMARQRGWPVPVWETKPETDACYERLTRVLLENEDAVGAAFASHNIRSLAHAIAQAESLGLDRRACEFQVLYGMADAIRSALIEAGVRVRVYCPIGDLLPGMAYLVRRLLENTSNEGFLANTFAKGADREALLRSPTEATQRPAVSLVPPRPQTFGVERFENEPPTDFTVPAERDKVRSALADWRRRLGRKYPLVIHNRPVETREWVASLNPANHRETIGLAALATVSDADAAIEAARKAQTAWGRRPAEERAALLDRWAALLRRDKAALTALCILEAGKNWSEADADVAEAIDFCEFYAAGMRVLGKPQRTQRVPGETNHQHWWPRGVGVVVSPWNFPLAILTGMASAAVVAGNAVILKPSNQTPVIAARLVDLAVEAGFPPGVINLVTGRGVEIGARLVAHPQVDFIAFTGSMEVGLDLWRTAGQTVPGQVNLKKVICEMGGKNCLIVDSDADLDEAVIGAVHSAFGYLGQKCSALSRLVVLEDNYTRFVNRLLAATASLRVGPAEEPGTMIGPVIDRGAQQRILGLIEAGRRDATLAWQGRVPDDPEACYVPPTIFTDVPATSRLFREEIFGPVLSVIRARDFEQALELANDSAFALTGGIYSRSPVNIERARAEMICGNLYINRPITGALVGRQPFGGFRLSGAGTKAGGLGYLEHFLIPRVVTENCLRRGFAPAEA